MKKFNKNAIICLICIFFMTIMLIIGLVVPKLSNTQIKINPFEFEATVVDVTEKEGDYLITLQEYDCKLFIKTAAMLDEEDISKIAEENKIFFKLPELESNPLENPAIEQIFVVTLRTETEDIITIDSYYESEKQGFQRIEIVCIICAIIAGGVAVYNILKIVRAKKAVKN